MISLTINQESLLIKRICASTPPGKEQTKPNCLKHPADSTNSNSIEGSLFSEDLAYELGTECKVSVSCESWCKIIGILTLGAELAMKIKLPK